MTGPDDILMPGAPSPARPKRTAARRAAPRAPHAPHAAHASRGPRPFLIFPWDTDFPAGLTTTLIEATNGRPGDAVFVFPHGRPGRYLVDRIRRAPDIVRPCLLPRVFTVRQMFTLLRAHAEDPTARPARPIPLLDRVGLLMDCVRDLARPGDELYEHLAATDQRRFFPWGVRLAALMEEFFVQNRVPEDYQYMEGQVAPFAAALLGALGRIHEAYAAALTERGWTTPGFDAFRSVRLLPGPAETVRATERPDGFTLPPLLAGKRLFVAGFSTLTGTEEALFLHLWRHEGTTVCLHTDAAVAELGGRPVHWTCEDHVRWLTSWRAGAALACPPSGHAPSITFHEGYDLHSQLLVMERELRADGGDAPGTGNADGGTQSANATPSGNLRDSNLTPAIESTEGSIPPAPDADELAGTAVVLPDTGLLMPVLHHLPDKDVNISMGYPLVRSTLVRLVETLMRLQETARPAASLALPEQGPEQGQEQGPEAGPGDTFAAPGGSDATPSTLCYHWRTVIECIRHPYLKMLELDGERPLRDLFHLMENVVRGGGSFVDPRALARQVVQKAPGGEHGPAADLLHRVLDLCLTRWETADTPARVADAVGALCDLLLAHGGTLWERFPIDAECLFRLMQRVIPALRDCELADTPFPREVLHTILRETLREERVPFEATPLAGLQVLGMLETRLLRFRRVIVLDATEDRLPGAPGHDPLLPDSLRAMAGLPDSRRRERVAAHNFHRLLAGAEQAVLCYQTGVDRSGLLDEKKIRSRFVEELLWREERARGSLLSPGQPPLHAAACTVRPFRSALRPIERTAAINDALERLLDAPVSPSTLDAWLTCPVRFFHERLAGLAPPDEVNEGDDPIAVGDLLHKVLLDFHQPHKGREVRRDELSAEQLTRLFLQRLGTSGLSAQLPPDALLMLEVAGPERLGRYLSRQPERFTVLDLEEPVEATIDVPGSAGRRVRRLHGRVDRVDQRDFEDGQGAVILDYKTGKVEWKTSAWSDDALWERIEVWTPDRDPDLLADVAGALHGVQLPAYVHMYGQHSGRDVHDAAWVILRDAGQELPLFGDGTDDETRDAAITTRIPALLSFLLRHMAEAPLLLPRDGKHCDWCSCAKLCKMRA
ncbi:PD-(D/E)XK nuclease family protein [Nitratidesulfovibrio liaohensis]|uniref:PD-(D/E)XK nuclease family protein n=1 Tax=Nitratidesulfovibrio liaohensis TaxID=2604158 RepID=A0ABY9R3P0_9BACT|nr:PD-(D/E)XK nuclease family protein [Nitratidesulfovibrio liaohensis]WMW66386.1 PD-(D/E)XK nuclease family protein [Nitratidesulfovibrio liaohensis]